MRPAGGGPDADRVRPARRSVAMLAVGAAVVIAAGLIAGLTGILQALRPAPGAVSAAQAPPDTGNQGGPMGRPAPENLPVRSNSVLVVEPGPSDELDEDVPAAPRAGRPRVPEPNLPDVRPEFPPPTPARPAEPLPPKTGAAPVAPDAGPAPPPDRSARPKLTHPDPVERKRPPAADPKGGGTGREAYAAVDAHALAAPAEAEASVATLAKYLARGAKTDRERARAAYRWVTDRIAYDAPALFSGHLPDPSPEMTLRRRMAVCGGYANLFVDLCQQSGLEAAVVDGYVKGSTYAPGAPLSRPDHAWGAVRLDGRWWLVDPTWGAGSLDGLQFKKEFSDFYFLTPPEFLIFTHLPEDPRWQLREPPLNFDEFSRRPKVGPDLFELGVTADAVERAAAAPGFRDLVQTFRRPVPVTAGAGLPINRYLAAGREYRFEFRSEESASVAFIANGQFLYFKRDKEVFRGTIRPPRGTLVIGVKPKGGGRAYDGILEYLVE